MVTADTSCIIPRQCWSNSSRASLRLKLDSQSSVTGTPASIFAILAVDDRCCLANPVANHPLSHWKTTAMVGPEGLEPPTKRL